MADDDLLSAAPPSLIPTTSVDLSVFDNVVSVSTAGHSKTPLTRTLSAAMGSATSPSGGGPKNTVEKHARKGSLQISVMPKSLLGHQIAPPGIFSSSSNDPSICVSPSLAGDNHGNEPNAPRLLEPVPTSPPKDSKGSGGSAEGGGTMTKLMKRESYKALRKNYQREKKRVANELVCMLKDPSIIVLADWLKIRGTLKGWTKLWSVLKPGLLLLYKSPKTHKSSHWVGTVLLSTCELIERPSKKDGFCFKLYHPMEQSIWATRGPSGETIGAVVQPLPTAYLIFRAPSESAGKCWMDALELALRCSGLLIRSMSRDGKPEVPTSPQETTAENSTVLRQETSWNESDYEEHFVDHDLGDDQHTEDCHQLDGIGSMKSTDSDSEGHDRNNRDENPPVETFYVESSKEEFGVVGDAGQTEEVADENKSLIWALVKQVRPGMDLSKVVFPTFILEPRSFLDKLSDYYYHADIMTKAVQDDDPFNRMKFITQFYLSGFYKKPKGLKKPYNPILGEVFRCYWKHPNTGTRTFYISEQVSHHPPHSAFYVTNRKEGFCISGSILAKSKFYGNSVSAVLEGKARLTILTRGEDYTLTMPYAHCKGILLGTLTMELGGLVSIECEKTGYRTELDFKLKPFLGGSESSNLVIGKIKLGKETLANLDGHWDQDIYLTDKRTNDRHLFWSASPEIKAKRLKRFTVALEHQKENESEKLWKHVSAAIVRCDQIAATEEKTVLEDAQRMALKERKAKNEEWIPRHFEQDIFTGEWVYKHADSRPWDAGNDFLQYECDFVIKTKTRLKTPIMRTGSVLGVDAPSQALGLVRTSRNSRLMTRRLHSQDSESSSPEGDPSQCSDSSDSETTLDKKQFEMNEEALERAIKPMKDMLVKQSETLNSMQRQMAFASRHQNSNSYATVSLSRDLWLVVIVVIVVQFLLHWFLNS